MRKQTLTTLIICLVSVYSAQAANLASSGPRARPTVITLTGEIAAGDANTLRKLINAANSSGRPLSGIRLNSIGGNLGEASRLAQLVRDGNLSTAVAEGDSCASACFLVFAAGAAKFAEYGARIGVHGASDPSGRETIESGAATVLLARAIRELGVPAAIIGKMVVTRPSEMVWLTPDELRSMGATMVGKPALPPREQVARLPLNISPSGGSGPALTWRKLLETAIATSALQNDGRPVAGKLCDPRTNECWYGVAFKDADGVSDILVKALLDTTGKTLRREVCTFLSPGEVRVCVDWDTLAATRQVKDRQGNWVEVAEQLLPSRW